MTLLLRALALLTGLSLLSATTGPAAARDASFDYPRTPDHLLIDYSRIYGKVAHRDRADRLRLYGDGRLVLHRPFWQLGGGDFATVLSEEEIQQLLDTLLEAGVLRFDTAQVHDDCAQVETQRRESSNVQSGTSDDTRIRLSIRLDGYQNLVSGSTAGPVDQQVRWRNLAWSARSFPEIAALQDLERGETVLRTIFERDDLQPITAAEALP